MYASQTLITGVSLLSSLSVNNFSPRYFAKCMLF
jgi:hypothetical protein